MDMVALLLLAFGGIGAWAGWSLATKLLYRRPRRARGRLAPRAWRTLSTIVFGSAGVAAGFLTLLFLGA